MDKSLRAQAAELLALALEDPSPGARFWMMDTALALHRLANERGEPLVSANDDHGPGSRDRVPQRASGSN